MTEKELMLTALLECDRADLCLDPKPLSDSDQKRLDEMHGRRQKGEPLQYILGCCEFFGIKLFVDHRVLIPRPETELLVEEVLKRVDKNKSLKILDLGTGSGNIAVSLAKFLPRSQVTALDVSLEALKLAQDNAHFHSLRDKINFICQDMNVYLAQGQERAFDLIVSNPPYIAKGKLKDLPLDVQQEPKLALDGGENGLDFYKTIIPQAARLLKQGGSLFLEIGEDQRKDIENIFSEYHFYQNIEFLKDYCSRDRMIVAQIKE